MPRRRLCTDACLCVLVCAGAFALARAQNTSTAPNTRPVQCGDYTVNGNETCDDGNTQPGDGCSGLCTIEAGYMCEYSYRAPEQPAQPGVLFNWLINNTMVLTSTPETCTGASLCLQSALWRPENWVALYAAGTVLPPSGYYCGDMCKLFPTPQGYRMGDSCQLEGVNECIEGLAACAYNSECEDKLPHETATGLGYVCRCDPQYFTTDVNGLGCAQSGVEITAIVAGKSGYDPAESPAPDIAVLEGVRAALEGAGLSPGVCVLRKDFVVDEYMLLEARAHGADTALLIVAVLEPHELKALMAAAKNGIEEAAAAAAPTEPAENAARGKRARQ